MAAVAERLCAWQDGEIEIDPQAVTDTITGYTREAGVRELQRKVGALCRHVAVKVAEKVCLVHKPLCTGRTVVLVDGSGRRRSATNPAAYYWEQGMPACS